MPERHNYLIRLQFLGFRYSGWQKQPGQKTVEFMLAKTLRFILPGREFKVLGAGRTDARVSALDAAFELFIKGGPIRDTQLFLLEFNANLPPDIRATGIQLVGEGFNIIHSCKEKEYVYLFAFGGKIHPFAAPLMLGVPEMLDIDLMIKTAGLFEGTHNFRAFTAKSAHQKKFTRTITACCIEKNSLLDASFFPETSYMLRIRGQGFLRYQVRMIMGALISLGKGELSVSDIEMALQDSKELQLTFIAPGSGLLLHKLTFE